MKDWREAVAPYLPERVRGALFSLSAGDAALARELRLRAHRAPLLVGDAALPLPVDPLSPEEIQAMAGAMLGHAAHARQEEIRQGFVTLGGGFRVGLCGRAVTREGRVQTLQDISSLSVRIARAVPGAADGLMGHLLEGERPVSALIVSPPGLGKTTLLRDAARQFSLRGLAVCVVDERSELAACANGLPTLDLGPNTDVLDACPKAWGMGLVLRAMGPRVIVTDELGTGEDAGAVADAVRCGVSVLASAHGRDYADICARPLLRPLLGAHGFERIIALSGLGRVGAVYTAGGERLA